MLATKISTSMFRVSAACILWFGRWHSSKGRTFRNTQKLLHVPRPMYVWALSTYKEPGQLEKFVDTHKKIILLVVKLATSRILRVL